MVTVSNIGSAPTSGTVTVTETPPSGETLVSMAGTGWTCPASGTTCTRTDALANGSSYPAITVTVNGILLPVLGIAKTHTGSFTEGKMGATYTVTVSNHGSRAECRNRDGHGHGAFGRDARDHGRRGLDVRHAQRGQRVHANRRARQWIKLSEHHRDGQRQLECVHAASQQRECFCGGSANASTMDSTTIVEPVLGITKTHTGNFTQGQLNATYTVTVSNTGTALTGGTVTVSDTLPAGLTLVSVAGTGWTCVTTTASCTRADALATASSYPAITVTVNVASASRSCRWQARAGPV